MRELGNVFQLRRTPSLSSISLHWSFKASKSAIVCCVHVGVKSGVEESWWDRGRPQLELAGAVWVVVSSESGRHAGYEMILQDVAGTVFTQGCHSICSCYVPTTRRAAEWAFIKEGHLGCS